MTEPIICRFCGARSDGEAEETALLLLRCPNCRLDVEMAGGWNEVGEAIVKALGERFGKGVEKAVRNLAKIGQKAKR